MTAAPRRGVSPVVFGAGVWAGVIVSPKTMGSLPVSSVLPLVVVRRALGRSTAASMVAWCVSAARCGLDGLVVLGRGDGAGRAAAAFCVLLLPGLGAEIRVLGSSLAPVVLGADAMKVCKRVLDLVWW